MTVELVRYDAMLHAIVEAVSVDEVKDIRDKAVALQAYYRQAQNRDAERQVAGIRLHAQDRAGVLLRERKMAQGSRGQLSGRDVSGGRVTRPPEDDAQTLAEIGITKDQSSQWQRQSEVPEEVMESYLAECEVHDQIPSGDGLIRFHEGQRYPDKASPPIDPKVAKLDAAMQRVWGDLGRLIESCNGYTAADIFKAVPVPLQKSFADRVEGVLSLSKSLHQEIKKDGPE